MTSDLIVPSDNFDKAKESRDTNAETFRALLDEACKRIGWDDEFMPAERKDAMAFAVADLATEHDTAEFYMLGQLLSYLAVQAEQEALARDMKDMDDFKEASGVEPTSDDIPKAA